MCVSICVYMSVLASGDPGAKGVQVDLRREIFHVRSVPAALIQE